MSSNEESDGGSSEEEMEMRKMNQAQNRKQKKSGGFQAMGKMTAFLVVVVYDYLLML